MLPVLDTEGEMVRRVVLIVDNFPARKGLDNHFGLIEKQLAKKDHLSELGCT